MTDFTDILIPAAIAIIMLGIGLNLTFESFKRVFVEPKAILTGLSLQMLLLPAFGFLIAFLWDLNPAYKVGIVLIAACPGGTASNLVTHLLNGRTALSISMTSFNSFLILFSIPFFTSISLGLFSIEQQNVSLPFLDTVKNIGFTVILPVLAGLLIRHYYESIAARVKPYLKYILPGLLLIVFVIVAFDTSKGELTNFQSQSKVVLPLLILNVSTILIGYWVSGLIDINHDGRYTIGIEMGLQNSALAIFIATQILQNNQVAMVAVVYSSFSFFTTLGAGYVLTKMNGPK